MELKYFDICNGGLLPDIMHDVLEGALVYEAKLIMQHCIHNQYLSFTTLSQTLESMELGYMEVGNRPCVQKKLGQTVNQLHCSCITNV